MRGNGAGYRNEYYLALNRIYFKGKLAKMYEINDVLTMKKPHPCGGREWTVVRVGADVKLRCCGCGRLMNLDRDELKKRLKRNEKERLAVD